MSKTDFARRSLTVAALLLVTSPAAYAAGSQARIQAATAVATADAQCKSLGDFYWEIGDGTGRLASGQIGSDYSADQTIRIASSSKFVFGAYVLEKIGRNNQPTPEQVAALEMRSGYTSFNPLFCGFSRNVDGCASVRSNGQVDPAKLGRFSYGGGHDQHLASTFGLGRLDAAALTAEITRYVGPELGFSYKAPQLAGGMESSPAQFAAFLRKIIKGQLRMKDFLGYQPVCAMPSATCTTAVDSPVKEAWHYSINHWVEDDPATGDGAFSSPGALGFYPWISKDKTTYGVLARTKINGYWDSVLCGRKIRKAYLSAN